MTVQRLLDGKGTFVPVISYDATLREAIAQLEIDNAGALVLPFLEHWHILPYEALVCE